MHEITSKIKPNMNDAAAATKATINPKICSAKIVISLMKANNKANITKEKQMIAIIFPALANELLSTTSCSIIEL